jgi:hypothetical protein
MRPPRLLRLAVAALVLAGGLHAATPARAQDGETSRERWNLSPAWSKGEVFRYVHKSRQTTITDMPFGRFSNKVLNFSDYDAYIDLEATVTIEEVDAAAEALVWSAHFERFRFDVPNPLESEEYRKRMAEGRREGMERDAHPVEGETIKFDRSGPKTKVFKVLKDGEDYQITKRYPELLAVMQILVEPDWVPTDSVPLYGAWNMPIDALMRMTRVVMRAPIEGKLRCRLSNVSDGRAQIDVEARVGEEFRRVKMEIEGTGKIDFDVKRRKFLRSEFRGEVEISSKTSSIHGLGKFESTTEIGPAAVSSAPGK